MTHNPDVPVPPFDPRACTHPAHDRPVRVLHSAFPLVRVRAEDGPCRRLVDEWDAGVTRAAHLRAVNSWHLVPTTITHMDEVLVAAGFGRAVDDNDGDHILWHLAVLARTEHLAGRVVLQRVLPALLSHARRHGATHPGGTSVALDDLLACAWETVLTYPAERRPAKVAANIVLDSQYRAFVAPVRKKRAFEIPVDNVTASLWPQSLEEPVVDMELAEVLAEAESLGVDRAMTDLLRLFASGRNSEDIAAASGWSPRTIRNRRAAAVEAVRRALAAEVSA